MLISLKLLREDVGWYTIGTMGFLSQEMFKPLLNFTTSLDQSKTWGGMICLDLLKVGGRYFLKRMLGTYWIAQSKPLVTFLAPFTDLSCGVNLELVFEFVKNLP